MENDRIPHFHEAYYKARRSVGILAGLLISWELLDGEIANSDKPILPSLNLKFPETIYQQGIPYILLFGLLYYLGRYWIEWKQSNQERRDLPASKTDYKLTFFIALAAIIVFVVTTIIIGNKLYENVRLIPFIIFSLYILYKTWSGFLTLTTFLIKRQNNKRNYISCQQYGA